MICDSFNDNLLLEFHGDLCFLEWFSSRVTLNFWISHRDCNNNTDGEINDGNGNYNDGCKNGDDNRNDGDNKFRSGIETKRSEQRRARGAVVEEREAAVILNVTIGTGCFDLIWDNDKIWCLDERKKREKVCFLV